METRVKISLMEVSLARVLGATMAADTKVAATIGLNTTMLAVLAALITRLTVAPFWVAVLAAASGTGLLTSLLCLSLSSIPRTSRPSSSLIFFGSIAKNDLDDYAKQVRALTDESYLDDLIQQCHRNAQIASSKYRWIQRAQWAWYISILPWLWTVVELFRSK